MTLGGLEEAFRYSQDGKFDGRIKPGELYIRFGQVQISPGIQPEYLQSITCPIHKQGDKADPYNEAEGLTFLKVQQILHIRVMQK